MRTRLKKIWMLSQESHKSSLILSQLYQILASQSNQQAEQTLGLVHSEQSLRNAKANMASASTSDAIDSEPVDQDFIDVDSEEDKEEDVEWINAPFFPMEHVLDE